ncbi:hypothetical protein AAVH_31784 [Aphelenchoides avenae]|nr:hypothetical protein AAVH_31784 [Aphelenchus avenae]
MVRKNRKPKDYSFSTFADEDYDDENPGVITDADGTRRTTRPGEVQEVLVGDALLAEQAAHQELRDQDEDEPENRQRTSSLAHTADLTDFKLGPPRRLDCSCDWFSRNCHSLTELKPRSAQAKAHPLEANTTDQGRIHLAHSS